MSRISTDGVPKFEEFMSLARKMSDLALWRVCNPLGTSAAAEALSDWDDPRKFGLVAEGPSGIIVFDIMAIDLYAQEGSWAVAQREMLETHWASVQAHPVYKWLSRRPGWSNALLSLDRKANKDSASVYANPLARFRFVGIAARRVGWYFKTKHDGREPRVLTKAAARKGLAQIHAILKLLKHEAVVLQGDEAINLRDALEPLQEMLVMNSESGTYKERSDGTLLERRFIQSVAKDLKERFGHVAPVLVSHIASTAGYDIHETTLRRILSGVIATKPRERAI